jgi:hypothetical protein
MSTKTISVNPDFFNIGKKKTKKKLSHSLRTNFNSLQKNILKNQMINKIKAFKKKKKKKTINDDNGYKDDYDDAVNFMEEIIQKRKTRKNRKKKMKAQSPQSNQPSPIQPRENQQTHIKISTPLKPNIPIQMNNFKANIKNDPPYGILKNGRKQLYSKYKQKLQNNQPTQIQQTLNVKQPIRNNNNILVFTDENNFGKQQSINVQRKNKLENLKEKYLTEKFKNNNNKKKKERFNVKNKKLIKRFILGKNSKTRKVAILIKNKKTRRLINEDCIFLKKKKLKQVKSVLVKNALIKVGTQAPEKLLREMYMNRYLAGDIRNSGGKNAEDILMHNWSSESS